MQQSFSLRFILWVSVATDQKRKGIIVQWSKVLKVRRPIAVLSRTTRLPLGKNRFRRNQDLTIACLFNFNGQRPVPKPRKPARTLVTQATFQGSEWISVSCQKRVILPDYQQQTLLPCWRLEPGRSLRSWQWTVDCCHHSDNWSTCCEQPNHGEQPVLEKK